MMEHCEGGTSVSIRLQHMGGNGMELVERGVHPLAAIEVDLDSRKFGEQSFALQGMQSCEDQVGGIFLPGWSGVFAA